MTSLKRAIVATAATFGITVLLVVAINIFKNTAAWTSGISWMVFAVSAAIFLAVVIPVWRWANKKGQTLDN